MIVNEVVSDGVREMKGSGESQLQEKRVVMCGGVSEWESDVVLVQKKRVSKQVNSVLQCRVQSAECVQGAGAGAEGFRRVQSGV